MRTKAPKLSAADMKKLKWVFADMVSLLVSQPWEKYSRNISYPEGSLYGNVNEMMIKLGFSLTKPNHKLNELGKKVGS
jgi:hypothetical protein